MGKKYLFLLSGDNLELAKYEVLSLVPPETDITESEYQILVLDSDSLRKDVLERLAFTHEVSELIDSCRVNDIENVFDTIPITEKKFCVRVRRIGNVRINCASMERQLGSILWNKGAKISVSDPEVIVRVYITESGRAYIGYLLHRTDKKQFLERQPDLKPYFRPGVILPKFARALVNISEVNKGNLLLDPMCGVGTILVEGGLMGVKVFGGEVFPEIVMGCKKNLDFYGIPVNLVKSDVKALPIKDESFDAIVTDFPYLRSSKSYGEIENLYIESINEFLRVLKTRKRAVIVSNLDIEDFLTGFKIEGKVLQRIHGTLTRRIYICRKAGSKSFNKNEL